MEKEEGQGEDSQAESAAEGLGEGVEIVAGVGGGDLRRGIVGGHGEGEGRGEGRRKIGRAGFPLTVTA